uniref:Uncharacterized protein n=1 Tax=Arion vulgaris TaxID=1028688 RepID=A0A0B6ZUL0_9EUPU
MMCLNADDEDEFSDFGGFEAAEPAADISASQSQAGSSPWAIFNAGNAPGRPDLLCAQNRFPTYLDPSDISGASAEPVLLNPNYPAENGSVEPQADLLNIQFAENRGLLHPARIAENILDGTLSTAAGTGFLPGHTVANGRLPDIGLGINENRIFGQAEELNRPASLPPVYPQLPELPQDDEPQINWANVEPQEVLGREEQNNLEPHASVEHAVVENAAVQQPADTALSDANRVTEAALQERLSSMIERHHALEEELQRVQVDLAAQTSRLQDIQTRHTEELEEIRRAGHDALTLVVDQYKEQSRTVVIEQQELAQRHLVETLGAQMNAFKEMLQLQQEVHEQQREEDRQELKRRIDRAVVESHQHQQEQFDLFLAKEQVTQKEALEKAVEVERAASQDRFRKAMEEEHEKMKAKFEELEVACSQKFEDERKKYENALKTAMEEERRLAQEQITLLVNEERERGRTAVRTALESSMVDVRAYIDEQRQADSRVRRRHLASLDVFLETSRQQIALLIESEKPDSTTPPPPTHPQNNAGGES